MRSTAIASATACLIAGFLALASSAGAHVTYNLAGYESGVAGSINGNDGEPANDASTFTNGPLDGYTGHLPVNWYSGMHSRTAVRTIQTGAGPTPAANSLLAQVLDFNVQSDPDLPTDRVLVVGGKSWTDPDNENQGWGHGMDFGLIHYSPVDTLLEPGPVSFTVTLADDPNDAPTPQLAMAIYGGWDSSTTSDREQTFITSPAPVDDPLGSSGLTLLDYVVASAPGETIERTLALSSTYGGHYTVFVAALGGAASTGQYVLTVTTVAEAVDGDGDGVTDDQDNCPAASNADQLDTDGDSIGDACDPFPNETNDLAQCLADLVAVAADQDADGRRDDEDACPGTAEGAVVDQGGCSVEQFCAGIDATTKTGQKTCKKTDWRNDEPLMKKREADCAVDKGSKGSSDDRCVPAS